MLTIEKEIDLVIDLKSANAALLSNKDIRALYQEAIGEDGWEGVLTVKGEDFVIACAEEDYWSGEYKSSTGTERQDYDANDDDITIHATSFGELNTWQTVSRYIEDGYFIVAYGEGKSARRFKVGSGKAEQL